MRGGSSSDQVGRARGEELVAHRCLVLGDHGHDVRHWQRGVPRVFRPARGRQRRKKKENNNEKNENVNETGTDKRRQTKTLFGRNRSANEYIPSSSPLTLFPPFSVSCFPSLFHSSVSSFFLSRFPSRFFFLVRSLRGRKKRREDVQKGGLAMDNTAPSLR